MITKRKKCRLCDHENLELVLPIAASPIADAYIAEEKLNVKQELFPLDLYLCLFCGHVQNTDIVDPDILFRDYTYVTSASVGLVDHYRIFSEEMNNQLNLVAEDFVLEIGSNDGSLLSFFKERGLKVLGVDPARKIADEANLRGIQTLPEFFNLKLARDLLKKNGPAKLIVANNVFAHSDNLTDILLGIKEMLTEGVFVFEVSYLVDIVDKFLFDTVYHEHVSYHSVNPLQRFFQKHGMEIYEVQRIASKGGSIRVFAQRCDYGKHHINNNVNKLIAEEKRRGFEKQDMYREYSVEINLRKEKIRAIIEMAIKRKKLVAGYGASTTVTTLIWNFDLPKKIEFLVDDNQVKHGLFAPVSHLPVFPSDELYTRKPDIVIILAWNYAKNIIKKHLKYVEQGGVFLIPLPEVLEISSENIKEFLF
jgi:hypothetical protein